MAQDIKVITQREQFVNSRSFDSNFSVDLRSQALLVKCDTIIDSDRVHQDLGSIDQAIVKARGVNQWAHYLNQRYRGCYGGNF